MYPRIDLDPKRLKNFTRHKHPWIFSGAIQKLSQPKEQLHGQLVSIFCDNQFIMHGYYNQFSQIAIRALSWQTEEQINQKFFQEKIRQAIILRKKFVLSPETTACRLIFAESDFLPGFIVDQYNHSYIIQIHTFGAEKLKQLFVQALALVTQEQFGRKPQMILEKSDIPSRKHEGMEPLHQELLYGNKVNQEIILENGKQFTVDFDSSQKTGFFLDQRTNRKTLSKYCLQKKVLNLFAYTGGFSIYSSAAGAAQIDSVDISKEAVKQITKNLALNNLTAPHQEIAADAFDFLSQMLPDQYDLIVIDPPAFVKSAKKIQEGIKGYLSLNQLALQKLPEDGILVTSSCSAALSDQDFFRMLNWAANAAGCQIQVIEKASQPTDHPLTPYFPEGEYLKFYVVRKVKL
jgi:23S rRNA (cytosine1962-C5)-methyltransferase